MSTATRKAVKSRRAFTGRDDVELVRFRVSNTPRRVWALGRLRAIAYELGSEWFEHKFRKPYPLLTSDVRGRRLYIIGGGYHVDDRRGIIR